MLFNFFFAETAKRVLRLYKLTLPQAACCLDTVEEGGTGGPLHKYGRFFSFRSRFSKFLDLQISSTMGYFKNILSAFPVYALYRL